MDVLGKKRKRKRIIKIYFCPECLRGWDDSISVEVFPRLCRGCRLKGRQGVGKRATLRMMASKSQLRISLQKYMAHVREDTPESVGFLQDGSVEYGIPKHVLEIADLHATRAWAESELLDDSGVCTQVPDEWSENEEHELMVGARSLTHGVFYQKY